MNSHRRQMKTRNLDMSPDMKTSAAMHEDNYMKAAQREAHDIDMRAAIDEKHYMKAAQREAREIDMRAAMHEDMYMKAAPRDAHGQDRYMRAVKAAHEVDMAAGREHDARMRAKHEDMLLETKMQRMATHSPFRHTSMTAKDSSDMHPETQFCQCHLKDRGSNM